MSKALVKFFHNPEEAEKAIERLQKAGYTTTSIGVLVKQGAEHKRVLKLLKGPALGGLSLPGVGNVQTAGNLATALKKKGDGDLPQALAQLLELPEGRMNHYQFGLLTGGVLLSLHMEETKMEEAGRLLREVAAEGVSTTGPTWLNSPGFVAGERITETNPRDAEMSGDFRRY